MAKKWPNFTKWPNAFFHGQPSLKMDNFFEIGHEMANLATLITASLLPLHIAQHQCCHSVMKKNPRTYLEKKTENNIKKTQISQNVKNKSKPNLKCTLLVLAHKN